MRKIWKILFQGLVVILPTALTIFIVYWLFYSAEALLAPLLKALLPDRWYFPGLGILISIAGIFLMGLLINAYAVNKLFQLSERIFEHIPLVKTLYVGLRDLMQLFSNQGGEKELKSVVVLELPGEIRLIGFITASIDKTIFSNDEELVAVYFPLSYQIGGYTLYVKREQVKPLDISVEQAMRMTLTAGVGGKASPLNGE